MDAVVAAATDSSRIPILDVGGYLAGAPLRGRFVAHRSGHTLNHRLLRAVFADRSAWREIVPVQRSVAAE